MESYFGPDGMRAALVLVLAVGQAVMAYWPDLRGWDQTITSRSSSLDTLLVPFGPFFAIWLLIFTSLLGFAVWHALPGNLASPLLRDIGWWAAALFAGNMIWEAYVPRRGLDWGSVAIIGLELVLAVIIALKLAGAALQPSGLSFWLGAAPLYFIAGWISVAVFANLSSTLIVRRPPLIDSRKAGGALVLIGVAAAFIAPLAYVMGTFTFAVSAIWGLLGIAAGAHVKKAPLAVMAAAVAAALAVFLSTLAG